MKKYFFYAIAILALSACTSDEYIGREPSNTNGSIRFAPSSSMKTTRAEHVGADAAKLLNNKFIVAGYKGTQSTDGVVTDKVFDHYIVNWNANTAGKTESNTSDWEYVGVTAAAPATVTGLQTIKYWDYGTGQYDFIAFSYGNATLKTSGDPTTGEVLVSAVNATNAKTAAYTIKGASDDLAKCYIADLVTAYNPQVSSKPVYGNEVQLKFRNLAAKARVALYETIPGYSVKDVHFYQDAATDNASNSTISEISATLFAPAGETATDNFYTAGTATVYFPTVGTGNTSASDYNKAHVTIVNPTKSKTQAFGTLQYKASDDTRLSSSGNIFLGTNSTNASYAGTTDPYYTTILPNETGTTLTLRVNYTLVSNDNSGEEIHVYGATAVVPSQYCQWKSNYAYTYIFKISDNTNGLTGLTSDKVGLYPITFDAVTVDPTDGSQETVTTVATPSITTYSPGVQPTVNNEYKQNSWIYVMVMDAGAIKKLNTPANPCAIYKMDKDATEAEVMDALNMVASNASGTITGRNSLVLTPHAVDATITTIPGVDGNNIAITAGQAALFQAETTGSYAVVYGVSAGVPTTYNTAVVLSAEPSDWNASDNVYYTDFACTQKANNAYANGTYYQKLTNNNNVFAVKVIKVVAGA